MTALFAFRVGRMFQSNEPVTVSDPPSGATTAVSRPRLERLSLIAAVVAVYGLLALMLVFVMPGLFGFRTYSGTGDSMGDTIPDGSLIVTRALDSENVEIGDVIAFRWPNFEHAITHRVVDIGSRGDQLFFITKGDGNATRDPFRTFGDQQIRRVIFTVPYLGTFLPVAKALIYVLAFAGGVILWRRRRDRRLALSRAMSVPPSSAEAGAEVEAEVDVLR
jgi:signal peptidase